MRSACVPPSELATFRLARFRLRLKAQETLYLPAYKGSALRGGFGQVFRRIACLGTELGFGECLLGARCPYHYIFETPPPAGSVCSARDVIFLTILTFCGERLTLVRA